MRHNKSTMQILTTKNSRLYHEPRATGIYAWDMWLFKNGAKWKIIGITNKNMKIPSLRDMEALAKFLTGVTSESQ